MAPVTKPRRRTTSANPITVDELAVLKRGASQLNRTVNSIHEYAGPKFTPEEIEKYGLEKEYGGITGTLRPGAFVSIGEVLTDPGRGLHPDFVLQRDQSVFCDVGSGTGRPSMYFGCLPLRASIGFDVDPMQVQGSQHALTLAKRIKDCPLRCPVATFHADVLALKSLEPSTHVFAFLGYSQIVQATARLVALASTVKVLVAVVLHEKELREVGILHTDKKVSSEEDRDVLLLSGLPMPGGPCYMAYVTPITDARRTRMLEMTERYLSKESKPKTGKRASSAKARRRVGPTIDAQVMRALSGGAPIGSEQERMELELTRDGGDGSSNSRSVCLTRAERRKQLRAMESRDGCVY